MSLPKIIIAVLIAAVLVFGVYGLMSEKSKLEGEVEKLSESAEKLQTENRSLLADLEYFKNPENLVKELKSQFNYHEAGEELIIVVPNATSSRKTSP